MTTKNLKEGGFAIGGGASGQSIVPGPVDTGSVKRAIDKDQGDKTADKVADVVPQGTGGASAEQNRASVAMKGSAADARTQAMESVAKIKELFAGQTELSEEFYTKAATIFEAVIGERTAKIEAEFVTKLEESTVAMKADLKKQLDEYLNYVVEKWLDENAVAVDSGLKAEITEDFMKGLKKLFTEHHITIPEDEVSVVEELVARVEELETKLNETMNENVELTQQKNKLVGKEIIVKLSEGLTATQKEKFTSLAEAVEFADAAAYEAKVKTIKESAFAAPAAPAKPAPQTLSESDAQQPVEEDKTKTKVVDPAINRYVEAISRNVKK